jgi:hypothetical protein
MQRSRVYELLANSNIVKREDRADFVKFFQERFPNESSEIYVKTWIHRWEEGNACGSADSKSQTILRKMGKCR